MGRNHTAKGCTVEKEMVCGTEDAHEEQKRESAWCGKGLSTGVSCWMATRGLEGRHSWRRAGVGGSP